MTGEPARGEPGFAAQLCEDLSPEDIRHVLDVFAADVARLSAVLRDAAAAGDVDTCRRVAHSLAGAAGAVGASALDQACRVAMNRTETGPAQFPATVAEIDRLCRSALDELAVFVAGMDAAPPNGRPS